jgi:hypothetical protein
MNLYEWERKLQKDLANSSGEPYAAAPPPDWRTTPIHETADYLATSPLVHGNLSDPTVYIRAVLLPDRIRERFVLRSSKQSYGVDNVIDLTELRAMAGKMDREQAAKHQAPAHADYHWVTWQDNRGNWRLEKRGGK